MSDRNPGPPPQKLPFALAAGALLIGVLVAAIVLVNRVNVPSATATVPTPVASSVPTPVSSSSASASATAATIPFADCTTAAFGPPLQPLGAPADPHVYSAAPPMQIDATKLYEATITTPRGSIVLCLQPALAPLTVNNFVTLARNHFYDGLVFHRVVPSFVIQGGDPQGTGKGGPGYSFNDEPVRQQYTPGVLAMANSGPNTNGSQFFICTADDTTLPRKYNLFGRVASGLDIAVATQKGDVMSSVVVTQQQ